MFVPAFTQLPLFVFGTMLCSRFATKPTPLEDESFLTLTSLAHPDATGVLPIALGLVTLANVETGHWFLGEEKAARNAKLQKEKEEQREKARATGGKTPSNPNERRILLLPDARSLIQNALRVFSIVRIVIGVMVDGVGVTLTDAHMLITFLSPITWTVCPCILALIRNIRTLADMELQLVGCKT